MTDARPTPTPQEREQLSQFARIVDAMSRRRFIERLREQDQAVSFGGEMQGPEYDREDFDAFLTDFRKVAVSDNEPVYLTKALGTVGKLASDDLRQALKVVRRQIIAVLDGKVSVMNIGYEREGQGVTLTPEQILSALVNGEVFHVDPEHARTAAELRGLGPLFYLWPAIHFFVMPIVRACRWLFLAIRQDGILGWDDYPARCRPAPGSQPN